MGIAASLQEEPMKNREKTPSWLPNSDLERDSDGRAVPYVLIGTGGDAAANPVTK